MKKLIILNHSLTLNKIELYAFEEGKAQLPDGSLAHVFSSCLRPVPYIVYLG